MNQLKHLLAKVRALFALESKLTNEQKGMHQWQLLTEYGGVQYVVGKGGINTAFYKIGDEERQVCYPEELIIFLTNLTKQKYASFAICNKQKQVVYGPFPELGKCKGKVPKKPGFYIVGIDERKKLHRLYYNVVGLSSTDWVKFQ